MKYRNEHKYIDSPPISGVGRGVAGIGYNYSNFVENNYSCWVTDVCWQMQTNKPLAPTIYRDSLWKTNK